MAVDIGRLHYKGTSGPNKGWRRSRLGGGSGSHFYAWWATAGSAPLKRDESFEGAESEAVFLRDIRHHDDHAPLAPGSFGDDYLPLTVSDMRMGEYAPEPWTAQQVKFAKGQGPARILKGHPGSGKTTALLHAADSSRAEKVLYLTFSQDLAALARDYFDRFCSKSRTFTVMTFPVFLRQLLGPLANRPELNIEPAEGRTRFRKEILNHQRSLGPWANDIEALYDEIHAHVAGAALPEKSGRFPKAERQQLPEAAYQSQRGRYLGAAAPVVSDALRRLEKSGDGPVMDRYFPELALAWRAAQALSAGKELPVFEGYGCIAVDEAQDLTPLESFVVMKLARRLNEEGRLAPLLLAGDEAQTVRPTDFEWAWLNDMLHSTLSAPQEFKMQVNLRSPKRIADIVNRSWDYYDFLHKQDRPSGTGYAEIEDDSPDQILYSALPEGELGKLMQELSQREGLAMIAFDKASVPKETLPFVLSPSEAKGLDFHSVCVLNGGPLLRKIVSERTQGPAQALGKRLAIDQLRVVLSRPTERLLWVDAAPEVATVLGVSQLLRSSAGTPLRPITADALRTCLDEEELDVEERIQRCQRDARQLVVVKPDLAWSRAHQAVALLGTPGDLGCVTDPATREAAQMTLAEVCFQLAFRKRSLSPELGRPDLNGQASEAARHAGKMRLAAALTATGAVQQAVGAEQTSRAASAIQTIARAGNELPAWFTVEVTPRVLSWVDDLDRSMETGDNPIVAQEILPPLFDALGLPDAQARKDRLAQKAVRILMKQKRHAQALTILLQLPERKPALLAECYEELDQFAEAAVIYLELGDRDKALKCYRSVPDFEGALELVRRIEGHPARASLEWLAELNAVVERRPENFTRVMTAPEKKLLEATLERGLGVQRKKPAAKKAGAKKAVAKKAAAKKPAAPKALRKRMTADTEWF